MASFSFLFLFFTDSVCYLSRPGLPDPPIGKHIGDLTDQISGDHGPGSFCFEFVSGGAKNYCYKVAVKGDLNNVIIVTKVRGITINSSNEDSVTFDNLKGMVLHDSDPHVIPAPMQIVRLPGWRIVTRDSSKKWQVCLNKRRRVDKEKTVPYGYVPPLDDDDLALLDVMLELAL